MSAVLESNSVLNATDLLVEKPLAKFFKHLIRPEGLRGGTEADPFSDEIFKPRGATFYIEATKRSGFVWVSSTICRDLDNFCRSTGRAIAMGRMEMGDAFSIENVNSSEKIEVSIYRELKRGLEAREENSELKPLTYMSTGFEYTIRRHRELLYILKTYSPAVKAFLKTRNFH